MEIVFILVTGILIFIFIYNKTFNGKLFIKEVTPFFKALTEDDYDFLIRLRYEDEDVNFQELYEKRIRNSVISFVIGLFVILLLPAKMYAFVVLDFVLAYFVFKYPYIKLKSLYKRYLHMIDMLLPYYLKGLEILVQHYTVPVALSKSITSAPKVFRKGLLKIVAKIDAGDSTIQPYIDFANEYPVRDSMRMMRLLYRLSLGSQENKQEQVMAFSRMASTLQNKARELKYQNRLDRMEKKTMVMLFATGGGVMGLLFMSMMFMIQI